MSRTYTGYRIAQWLSTHLPLASAFGCAEPLADAWSRVALTGREAVRTNLSMVLGNETPHASLIREVFRNFGRYLVEFFTIHQTPQPEVTLEGHEHLVSAQRTSRGVIILTGHLGNWEVGAVLLRRMGFPITVVALPHNDPGMDRLFNRQRERCGLQVIPIGADAAHRSLRSLHEGHLLGLLGDREFMDHGVALPLFQQELILPSGPAMLSLRSRAPIVPTFLIREGRWKFRLCFEPPIWPDASETRGASIRTITQRYASILERYVKRFPDQWLMFQPLTIPPVTAQGSGPWALGRRESPVGHGSRRPQPAARSPEPRALLR